MIFQEIIYGSFGEDKKLKFKRIIFMQISPIKASLEAFAKFRAGREQNLDNNGRHTNPFGITFKGAVLQMDVFNSSQKAEKSKENPLKEKMAQAGKLVSSMWLGATNKVAGFKDSIISFGKKVQTGTKEFCNKLANTNVEFDFVKYNVNNLAKRPISELGDMFKKELEALEAV